MKILYKEFDDCCECCCCCRAEKSVVNKLTV